MSLQDLCALGKLWIGYDREGELGGRTPVELRQLIVDPDFWDAARLVASTRPPVRKAVDQVVAMTMDDDAKSPQRAAFLDDVAALHESVTSLLKHLEQARSRLRPRDRVLLRKFRKNLNMEAGLLEALRDTTAGYSARASDLLS